MSGLIQIEDIFKSNYTQLYRTAYNIIRNDKAAEDIVQEVFLKLWQKKDALDHVQDHKSYLFRSTINASIDFLKQSRKVIPISNTNLAEQEGNDTAENSLNQKELEAAIEKALNNLPPRCKVIFVLSRFEGMKYKEIAVHLNISIKTVENQMGIALEKMRTELKPYLTAEFIGLLTTAGISLIFYFL